MLSILGLLLPTALSLTGQIVDWQAKKINAQTEHERIEADEHIKMLSARRDVLVAEAGTPWNAVARAWLILPPSIYIAKLFVWDKVLGWGSTDGLSDNLWWIVTVIYAFYFLGDVSKIFKR